LNVQVQAGNPPDVAMLPQPGGMKNYASQGKLFPLPADIVASIDANYGLAGRTSGLPPTARSTASSTAST